MELQQQNLSPLARPLIDDRLRLDPSRAVIGSRC